MPNVPMPENLEFSDLNAVMLDFKPLPVLSLFKENMEGDLFFGDSERLKYAQGAVGESQAHLTLLFGIHPSPTYPKNVSAVLGGWVPGTVTISHVDFFEPIVEGQNYKVIVAKIKKTPSLLEANARLGVLTHSNRFDDWEPHVTLAYVNGDADIETWVSTLDKEYAGTVLIPTHINYGKGLKLALD